MIPENIVEHWRAKANWPSIDQIEQDLIISAALVCIFNDGYLKTQLAFRGGTALHKLVFPRALRYSEDIDMNRLEQGAAGEILDALRNCLKKIFPNIRGKSNLTQNSIKLSYKYDSVTGGRRKLKIEINSKETLPQTTLVEVPFKVNSDFFNGETKIVAFNYQEMIGTKIRALYQRRKGRDLFDLFMLSKEVPSLDWDIVVTSFEKLNVNVSKKEYLDNLDEKMKDETFLNDLTALLPSDVEYNIVEACEWFKKEIIPRLSQ